jgi:uncharacterized protein (DUF58 family)
MSPTPRAALALGAIALSALLVPLGIVLLAALALAAATVVDALSVRAAPEVRLTLPSVLARGVPAAARVAVDAGPAGRVTVRQPAPPKIAIQPASGPGSFDASIVASGRGRHVLRAAGVRREGRLGLGAWYHRAGGEHEVHVYPDLVTARRIALAAREGRLADPSRRARGPLGIGTDFESVRDWLPDDDVRHVNWRATQRAGRPMTNQYRLEQAREVVFLLDAGRLMASPVGDRTRLDAALDALTAVSLTADELGDHVGAIAFDGLVQAHLRPRRAGGTAVVKALFDLQPRLVDSDYERAFLLVAQGKRSLVMVLTDLFDDAAAASLVEAVPVLSRRHAVTICSIADPDLTALVSSDPVSPLDAYAAVAALDLLDARARAAALLRRAGARVVEAQPDAFAAACVRGYLDAKASLRL